MAYGESNGHVTERRHVTWNVKLLIFDDILQHSVVGYPYMRQLGFLADRTNGRAYATVLRLSSSVCLWRYVLWLNSAS